MRVSPEADSAHFVTGKNVLVTGSTAGIGQAIVYQLAELKPAKIFLACRTKSKGEAVQKQLDEEYGVAAQVLLGDLSCRAGCEAIVDAMLETGEPLHLLVSNAGMWDAFTKVRVASKTPGLEVHFMTNYLSMVIICKGLKELLEKSAPSRVIITGSFTHVDPGGARKGIANLDDMQFEQEGAKVTKGMAQDLTYTNSKLLQHMWAKKFATTVASGVAVMIYDPGMCETDIDVYKLLKKMLCCCWPCMKKCMGTRTPADGAAIALWACDSEKAAGCNGKYIDFGVYKAPKFDNTPGENGYSPTFKVTAASVADDAQVERLWTQTEAILLTPIP